MNLVIAIPHAAHLLPSGPRRRAIDVCQVALQKPRNVAVHEKDIGSFAVHIAGPLGLGRWIDVVAIPIGAPAAIGDGDQLRGALQARGADMAVVVVSRLPGGEMDIRAEPDPNRWISRVLRPTGGKRAPVVVSV